MKRIASLLFFWMAASMLWPQAGKMSGQIAANVAVVSSVAHADQGNPDVKVWVNTASGVYHCPGTRWYGNTKRGVYMTQAEAQKKGYRPAYGEVCR